jgi:hypothetical protein
MNRANVTKRLQYLFVEDSWPNAEHGAHWHTRFDFRTGIRWSRADADTASFRLPPSIYYGTFFLSDNGVVPVPGFYVNWFTLAEDSLHSFSS